MRLDSEKQIIPAWHDNTLLYLAVAVAMFLVGLFSLSGIRVALAEPAYQPHVWVPGLLLIMSGLLGVSALARLIRRLWRRLRTRLERDDGLPSGFV